MSNGEKAGPVVVTWGDDVFWLQCFADHPADGQMVARIDSGMAWSTLAAAVAEHQAAHGCREGIAP